jgi:hypothetical protein
MRIASPEVVTSASDRRFLLNPALKLAEASRNLALVISETTLASISSKDLKPISIFAIINCRWVSSETKMDLTKVIPPWKRGTIEI